MIIDRITEDFENLSDVDINKYSENFKLLKTSWLNKLIRELKKRTISIDKISLIKDELDWREKVREEVLSQKILPKSSWGLFPVLKHKTNWKITNNQLHILSMYVIYVMFWDIAIVFGNRNGFSMERPDGVNDNSNSKIKLNLDSFGNLTVRCVASGDLIYDNERNIRSLTYFLKAFEIIGKREGIIN